MSRLIQYLGMDMKRVGQKLKEARLAAGLTQEAVAGNRMATRTLQRLEDGDGNPTLATLEELAKALGCDVVDFLDVGSIQSPQSPTVEDELHQDISLLIDGYFDASPGQRAILLYTATGHERYLKRLEAIPGASQFAKLLKKAASK